MGMELKDENSTTYPLHFFKTYLMQHQFHPLHRVELAYSDEEQKQEPRNLESEIKKNLTQY